MTPGPKENNGCPWPDADNDSIPDKDDKCPTASGLKANSGCPDTDNDGVHDGIDRCPTVAGSPEHFGCPDTDADGVYDDLDRCITIPGVAANQGCPEIKKETKKLFEKALQGIQFETGKAIIKPLSFLQINKSPTLHTGLYFFFIFLHRIMLCVVSFDPCIYHCVSISIFLFYVKPIYYNYLFFSNHTRSSRSDISFSIIFFIFITDFNYYITNTIFHYFTG
jgi:hypothetical protein